QFLPSRSTLAIHRYPFGERRMSAQLHIPGRTLRPASDGHREFLADVLRGLRQPEKELPCKYFYDAAGSELFEQICNLDDYYLTRTELAIMHRHVDDMASLLGPECMLIEYGSCTG